jgi:hypothetical protein
LDEDEVECNNESRWEGEEVERDAKDGSCFSVLSAVLIIKTSMSKHVKGRAMAGKEVREPGGAVCVVVE